MAVKTPVQHDDLNSQEIIDGAKISRVYIRNKREREAIEAGDEGDFIALDSDGNVVPRKRKTIFEVAREQGIEF